MNGKVFAPYSTLLQVTPLGLRNRAFTLGLGLTTDRLSGDANRAIWTRIARRLGGRRLGYNTRLLFCAPLFELSLNNGGAVLTSSLSVYCNAAALQFDASLLVCHQNLLLGRGMSRP